MDETGESQEQLDGLIKIDNGWYAAPVHDPDGKRLERLHSYGLLDTPPEAAFDRISALAAALFATPIALVNMIDRHRQWFKSCYGMGDMFETPLDHAFCTHALHSDKDVMVVEDASQDARFYNNPLVRDWPHIRFYADAPMTTADGCKIGTLCIIDRVPRADLSQEQKNHLISLADIAMDQVELSLANRKAGETISRLQGESRHLKDRPQQGQAGRERAANSALSSVHLLVAGDDAQLVEQLEALGCSCEHCPDIGAAPALMAQRGEAFDGMILGPAADSGEILKASRSLRTMQSRRYRHVAIIGLSPRLDREALELFIQAGINDVLQTPVATGSLRNCLREYFGLHIPSAMAGGEV